MIAPDLGSGQGGGLPEHQGILDITDEWSARRGATYHSMFDDDCLARWWSVTGSVRWSDIGPADPVGVEAFRHRSTETGLSATRSITSCDASGT